MRISCPWEPATNTKPKKIKMAAIMYETVFMAKPLFLRIKC
jgi:hypothetical protein